MFQQILLAIDVDDKSSWQKAAPIAVELCRLSDAKLHVLTVLPGFGMTIVGGFFQEGFEAKAREKVLEALHEFTDAHIAKDIEVQHIVDTGTIYEEIVKMSDEISADLIVVAAHRPELKDYLLGPNAARVVRHARCSVLVVR